jgi:hypothetical protein
MWVRPCIWCLFIEFTINFDLLVLCHSHARAQSQWLHGRLLFYLLSTSSLCRKRTFPGTMFFPFWQFYTLTWQVTRRVKWEGQMVKKSVVQKIYLLLKCIILTSYMDQITSHHKYLGTNIVKWKVLLIIALRTLLKDSI